MLKEFFSGCIWEKRHYNSLLYQPEAGLLLETEFGGLVMLLPGYLCQKW